MIRIIAVLSCFTLGMHLYAQSGDITDYIPTENIDMKKDANKKENRRGLKRYSVIYKPDGKGILYGNQCALDATRKMGFEYMVEPKNVNRSASNLGRFWNNLRVKTKLVFTRSPFWKLILNKKFKECRPNTGDIVG